ncbi:MAG: hypothetical protein M1538_02855 [Candidatus Marsarchaeota archaeon]|jgi:hypothetical protein|nr:hypothetical protein [Candidatus Marsarchaeota archaeon]
MFGKKILEGRERAQSAMEYLMTYGWAILIIAIVLAILFKLGVFSGASLTGTSCLGSPGFSCSNPVLSSTAGLSFSLGQSTGSELYNVLIACSGSSGAAGYPADGTYWDTLSSGGAATPNNALPVTSAPASTASLNLANGQSVTVSNVICYDSSNSPTTGYTIGQSFQGYIWLAYSTSSTGTPIQTQKAITISVKATS